jgi:hypothetical protein
MATHKFYNGMCDSKYFYIVKQKLRTRNIGKHGADA